MAITPGARTLYELAIENADQRILLAYCSNCTRRTIWKVASQHCDRLMALTGAENIDFAKRAGDGATMGAWRIRWTGRTQREAADSKLQWIGDTK